MMWKIVNMRTISVAVMILVILKFHMQKSTGIEIPRMVYETKIVLWDIFPTCLPFPLPLSKPSMLHSPASVGPFYLLHFKPLNGCTGTFMRGSNKMCLPRPSIPRSKQNITEQAIPRSSTIDKPPRTKNPFRHPTHSIIYLYSLLTNNDVLCPHAHTPRIAVL
jgi:hypothetical protein